MDNALINIRSFDKEKHSHIQSIYKNGLWGFAKRYKNSWSKLQNGSKILLYGDGAIKLAAVVEDTYYDNNMVEEWTNNPKGYPLRLKVKLLLSDTNNVVSIGRNDLVEKYNLVLAKKGFFGHQIVNFGEKETYSNEIFDSIWRDFCIKNNIKI